MELLKFGGTIRLCSDNGGNNLKKILCLFCARNLTFITWFNKPKVNYNLSYYVIWKGLQFKICHSSQTCLSGLYDSKPSATSLSESGAASCWLIGLARLTVNTMPNNTERTRAFIVPRRCETCRPFTEENFILAPLNCYCACWKGRPKALDCVNLPKIFVSPLPDSRKHHDSRHEFSQYLLCNMDPKFVTILEDLERTIN